MTDYQEGMTGFDRFVAELQQQINEQEQALYSARVIEEAYDPKNLEGIGLATERNVREDVAARAGHLVSQGYH